MACRYTAAHTRLHNVGKATCHQQQNTDLRSSTIETNAQDENLKSDVVSPQEFFMNSSVNRPLGLTNI